MTKLAKRARPHGPVELRVGRRRSNRRTKPRLRGGWRVVITRPAGILIGCYRCRGCKRWIGKLDLVRLDDLKSKRLFHYPREEPTTICGPLRLA